MDMDNPIETWLRSSVCENVVGDFTGTVCDLTTVCNSKNS
jgi:hypothetical protein